MEDTSVRLRLWLGCDNYDKILSVHLRTDTDLLLDILSLVKCLFP
jgi:hypothetical protein